MACRAPVGAVDVTRFNWGLALALLLSLGVWVGVYFGLSSGLHWIAQAIA